MASYKRRVDICLYPMPAGATVAAKLNIKREHDILIFGTPLEKLEFDRLVKEESRK